LPEGGGKYRRKSWKNKEPGKVKMNVFWWRAFKNVLSLQPNSNLVFMLYKFLILSDEVDDFMREITIDASATFFDLHNAILDSVNYEKDQITSFFLCDDEWEKQQEITLIEMETSSEYDNLVMDATALEDYVTDEKQKLLYYFDLMADRAFFITMQELIPRQNSDKAVCTRSEGQPPKQFVDFNEMTVAPGTGDIDEQFYGDEEFNADELDSEGFGDVNFEEESQR
jgi:hypothetical protein